MVRGDRRSARPIIARGDPASAVLARYPRRTMRRIFLWMAGNRWLRDRLPRLRFTKRAVRKFMPGEGAESALVAAEAYRVDGIKAMFTRLGENLVRIEDADAIADHYLELIDTIKSRGIDGEVSVKLTQLGFDLDEERTFAHVSGLAERAKSAGQTLWIDMESSAYAERTIAFYERLIAVHPNCGVCFRSGRRSGSSRAPTPSPLRSPTRRSPRSTPTTSPSPCRCSRPSAPA